jgi:hypothetical protein
VKDPVTYLGEKMLPLTDVVLTGTADAPRVLPTGAHLLRLTVTGVISGTEPAKSILVVAGSKELLPPKGTTAVLFLKRLGTERYEPVGLVDATGKAGRERLGILRRYIEIEAIPDAVDKRTALRDFLLENLESKSRFRRWSAARELANFTRANGRYLRTAHLERIRKVRGKAREKTFVELIDTALTQAGAPPSPAEKKAVEELSGPAGPEYRELRLLIQRWVKKPAKASERVDILRRVTGRWLRHSRQMLLDALDDEDAAIRRLAATQLGEGEFRTAEPALRKRLDEERDRDVLTAVVYSLGVLKSTKALPRILALGKAPDLRRSAAFAAARIGGDLAKDWLDALLAAHNRETEEDRAVRRLVAFLRSEAFERQEKALAEIRKKRLK